MPQVQVSHVRCVNPCPKRTQKLQDALIALVSPSHFGLPLILVSHSDQTFFFTPKMGPRPAGPGTDGCCSCHVPESSKAEQGTNTGTLGLMQTLENRLQGGLSPQTLRGAWTQTLLVCLQHGAKPQQKLSSKTSPRARHKPCPAVPDSPWAIVFLSSNRLRKDSEATWGFPHLAVSSSTSSSNLIQRAVSLQCISWFLSTTSSFSSTNT